MRQRAPGLGGRVAAVRAFEARHPRHRLDASGHQFGAGNDQQDAGHGARSRRVDGLDVGVRVGRAQEHQMGLAGQGEVVSELAGAFEQGFIFEAKHVFAGAEAGGVLGIGVAGWGGHGGCLVS